MSKNEQKVANESTQIKVDLNEKEEINGWLNTLSIDLRIDVDGTVTDIKPKDEKEGYSLKEMYEMCNTDIVEFVYLTENKILVVDEESVLKKDRKINWEATKLLASLVLAQGVNPFFIFGNVMLIDQKNVQ